MSSSVEPTTPWKRWVFLPRRLGGAGVIVDVGFPPVFLVEVPVGDVHVIQGGMVVVVGVGGKEMTPVLSLVQVMRHVVVLVPVLQGLVLVMTPFLRHPDHHLPRIGRLQRVDRIPSEGSGQTEKSRPLPSAIRVGLMVGPLRAWRAILRLGSASGESGSEVRALRDRRGCGGLPRGPSAPSPGHRGASAAPQDR